MKSKLMIALTLFTLTAGSLLSVHAQKVEVPNKVPTMNPYSLKCTPQHGGDVAALVSLTNIGQAIPVGMKITVKTPGGTNTITNPKLFPANTTRDAQGAAGAAGPQCSAWVTK